MRKNIIQSKTEPNKNSIWLSEEGLKKYGKNGGEPLGSGGSSDLSLSNKILEVEVSIDNNFPEIKVKDYIDKIVIFKYPYNNAPLFRNYSIINVDSGGHIIEDYYILHYPGSEEITETAYIKVVYRPESLDENIDIALYEGNLLFYPFNPQGDGTKFLSNDGTYKEVSGGGGEPYIWDGNNDENTIVELKQAILDNRRILFNNIECITFIMNGIIMIKGNIPISAPLLIIDKNNNIEELKSDNFFIKMRSTIVSAGSYCYFDITQDTIIFIQSGDESETLPNTNEFNGEFTFGDKIYNVSFSAGLKWSTDSVLEYKPNHTYQFRILNNRGVMKEFANA